MYKSVSVYIRGVVGGMSILEEDDIRYDLVFGKIEDVVVDDKQIVYLHLCLEHGAHRTK